jgi:short-subunit dehydrogenase
MSLITIGATSAIAVAVAKRFHYQGHNLLLLARNTEEIPDFLLIPRFDGQKIKTIQFDVAKDSPSQLLTTNLVNFIDDSPHILVAAGTIEGLSSSGTNPDIAKEIIDVNFRNLVVLLTPIIKILEERRQGCLIFISSVAGDRGRQSNYVYGAAKAGLAIFAQGLRNRLAPSGVHVLTIKPGFVDTPMLRSALGDQYSKIPKFLISEVEPAANRICDGIKNRRNIIYISPVWRLIMLVICLLPESIFKRLRL